MQRRPAPTSTPSTTRRSIGQHRGHPDGITRRADGGDSGPPGDERGRIEAVTSARSRSVEASAGAVTVAGLRANPKTRNSSPRTNTRTPRPDDQVRDVPGEDPRQRGAAQHVAVHHGGAVRIGTVHLRVGLTAAGLQHVLPGHVRPSLRGCGSTTLASGIAASGGVTIFSARTGREPATWPSMPM